MTPGEWDKFRRAAHEELGRKLAVLLSMALELLEMERERDMEQQEQELAPGEERR